MEHYRRTAHARFDLKYHFVWITKYRKKLLRGEIGTRLRQIVRDICAELEVEIIKEPRINNLTEFWKVGIRAAWKMQPLSNGFDGSSSRSVQ